MENGRNCSRCLEFFEWSNYYRKSNGPNGYTTECKQCTKRYQDGRRSEILSYQKKWRKNNPEKAKGHIVKSKYGITGDEYKEMLERSDSLCYACGLPETFVKNGTIRSLSIDHDHETGKVRGLLCNSCNRAIGFAKDNADRLQACAEYLRRVSSES